MFSAGLIFSLSLFGLQNASFDILPEFQPKTIQVQTEALGLAASEVESLVTVNLEEMLTNTPWVENMKSTSIDGLSEIDLTFTPDTDIMDARQMVSEKLVLSSLKPNVSQQSIILQPRSTTNRVMVVGLSSKNLSLIDISQLSRWTIRPALMSVPGVSNVSIWGNRERQLQVQVDQQKIKYTGVSLEDLIKDTGNAFWMSNLSFLEASTPGSGGWIDTPNQRLEIQHILPIYNEKDLAQVPFSDLKYLTLGNVSNVVEGHQPLIGDAILDDGKGILLVIEKYPESDVLSVTRGVEEKLAKLKGGLSDMEIDTTIFRPATFIESVLGNLGYGFLIIFTLILFGFFVLFRKMRIAFFALLSMILSLVVTFFVLHLYGLTFNTVLFVGVIASCGVIIDQIINGFKKSAHHTMQVAIIAILLIIPVFFLGGETALFYKPLAISYCVSILLGMVFSLIVFPSLIRVFSSETDIQIRDFLFIKRLQIMYSNILAKMIKISAPIWIAVVGFLLIGTTAWLVFEDSYVFPKYNEPTLIVNLENAPGTSLIEMNRIVNEIGSTLQSIEGVSNFGADIGRAVTGDQVVGIHSSQIWVGIDKEADYDATIKSITESLQKYPEIVKSTETYSQEIIYKHITSKKENLFVRIYGIEFEKLREQAEEVKKSVSKIDGVINPSILEQSYVQASGIEIKVNTEITNRYGLKPGDVRRTVATLINGLEVANRFEEQKVYQVIVWSVPENRKDIQDIKNLLIDTPAGGHVRLSDIADVNIVPIMNKIERDKMSRYIDVVFETTGDKTSIVKNIKDTLGDIDFPLEYHAVVLLENSQNKNTLLLAIAIVVVGIFLLLQAIFGSWRLSTLIFFTTPVSLFGGVLAANIFGEGITSLGTVLGLLIVLGIAIQNGIRMIGHYQDLEKGESSGSGLVLDGARERLIPILATSFIMILIFVPILIIGNIPGFELLYPMSIVVIGGLITSNFINLFIIQVLYMWIRNKNKYES